MPANVDGMVREGISAYRVGRKEEARALLMRAVEIDQYNEQAWLWLSAVVESVDEQRTCLENVLTINPQNERARQGLQILSQKSAAGTSKPTAHADDILAGSSFTAIDSLPASPAPTSSTTPPAGTLVSPFAAETAADELPTSIEWEAQPPPTATSSSSSQRRVEEPSPTEYDDWVSNLNLGTSTTEQPAKSTALQTDAARFMAAPFDDDEPEDFVASLGITDVDDMFSAGPFTVDEAAGVPGSRTASPAPQRSAGPLTSPGAEFPSGADSADSLLDSLESDDVLGTAFAEDYDEMELEKLEADEFFKYLPKDIKATRLPGTRERYPFLVIVGMLLVIVLNLGAIAFFVMRMTSS